MKKILLFALVFISSCNPKWNYENVEKWGELDEKYKFCKVGFNQSPVDVVQEFKDNGLEFNYQNSDLVKEKIPYQLRMNFYGKSFLTRVKKKYFLQNITFHHPSEHAVKGQPHSLEMQVAHKSDDEQWLILSVFFEVGEGENKNYSQLVDFISSNAQEQKFNPKNLVNFGDKTFFYDGSFTTPPCLEGVKWYLMENVIKISKEQMNKIIKGAIFSKMNARNLQKFNPEKY